LKKIKIKKILEKKTEKKKIENEKKIEKEKRKKIDENLLKDIIFFENMKNERKNSKRATISRKKNLNESTTESEFESDVSKTITEGGDSIVSNSSSESIMTNLKNNVKFKIPIKILICELYDNEQGKNFRKLFSPIISKIPLSSNKFGYFLIFLIFFRMFFNFLIFFYFF
jgi:hypothetical protein